MIEQGGQQQHSRCATPRKRKENLNGRIIPVGFSDSR